MYFRIYSRTRKEAKGDNSVGIEDSKPELMDIVTKKTRELKRNERTNETQTIQDPPTIRSKNAQYKLKLVRLF